MRKGYRIISVEATDIYKHEQTHGVAVGFKMPEEDDAYFWLFKNVLDASLDLGELEKAYKRICRKKFSFRDKYNNEYALAAINENSTIYIPLDGIHFVPTVKYIYKRECVRIAGLRQILRPYGSDITERFVFLLR